MRDCTHDDDRQRGRREDTYEEYDAPHGSTTLAAAVVMMSTASAYPRGRSLSFPIPAANVEEPLDIDALPILRSINPKPLPVISDELSTDPPVSSTSPLAAQLQSRSASPAAAAEAAAAAAAADSATRPITPPVNITNNRPAAKQGRWHGYSPIHIQPRSRSSSPPPPQPPVSSRTISSERGVLAFAAADDSTDSDEDEGAERDAALTTQHAHRRHRSRNTSSSPRFRMNGAAGQSDSPAAPSVAHALAGLPPPLSRPNTFSSTASTSNTSPIMFGGSGAHSALSTPPPEEVTSTDNGVLPGAKAFGGIAARRRRHSTSIFAPRSRPSSFSTPHGPPTSTTPTPSSRRSTPSAQQIASMIDAVPDTEAYVELLQRLLNRVQPVAADVFRIDALQAVALQSADEDDVASSAVPKTLVTSTDSAPTDATPSRALQSPTDSANGSLPVTSGTTSNEELISELLALAQSYRDELVLERFHRKQIQSQLHRRGSITAHQQQQRGQPGGPDGLVTSDGAGLISPRTHDRASPLPVDRASPAVAAVPFRRPSLLSSMLQPLVSSNSTPPLPPPVGHLASLAPSHLDLTAELEQKRDEVESLTVAFDLFKATTAAKTAASTEYASALEAKLEESIRAQHATSAELVDAHAQLSVLVTARDALDRSHAELARRHFTLDQKYATLKQSYADLPHQLSHLAQLTSRLHDVEQEFATYREHMEGESGGALLRLESQVHTLTSELVASQSELASAGALIRSLQQQQLSSHAHDDSTSSSSKCLDEMRAMAAQQSSVELKYAALSEKYAMSKQMNESLTRRLMELESVETSPQLDEPNTGINGDALPKMTLTPAVAGAPFSAAPIPFGRSPAPATPAVAVGTPDSAPTPQQVDGLVRINGSTRSPFSQSEKSAPIPIGGPSPQLYRQRSSSRAATLLQSPPQHAVAGATNANLFHALPQSVLGHAGLSGTHTSQGVLIPPHEQRLHAHRRASLQMLGRASLAGEINSSDDDLLEQQFSPTPALNMKRVYSPPLA